MNDTEVRLVKDWLARGEKPSVIAARLKRDKSCINRNIKRRFGRKKLGRKRVLTESQVDALEEKMKRLIVKAKGKQEVTVATVKGNARCKAHVNTILARFHERGIYFYALRAEPLLTDHDIVDRYTCAKEYVSKPPVWWCKTLHMVIDVTFFPSVLEWEGPEPRSAEWMPWGIPSRRGRIE